MPAPSQPVTPAPAPVDQTPADLDKDGIDDEEGLKAFNNGDGNGDGIPDYLQSNVSSVISKVTKQPITLAANGDCQTITKLSLLRQEELAKRDNRFSYDNGLVDYALECEKPGQSGIVTLYLDRTIQGTGSVRKFRQDDSFIAINGSTVKTILVGKQSVTTASFTVIDGGDYDDDGKADGKIHDPFGISTPRAYYVDYVWLLIIPIALYVGVRAFRARR